MKYNYSDDILNIFTDIINLINWLVGYPWSVVETIRLESLEWSFPSQTISSQPDPFN